jgi:hypothetical protein
VFVGVGVGGKTLVPLDIATFPTLKPERADDTIVQVTP